MSAPIEKKKPVFKKVEELRPGTHGHNLYVKVVEAKVVMDRAKGPRGAPLKLAECIVGDETGSIVFTAKNEQVDLAQPGKYLTLRNAKIDMYRGSMRLAVDQWGKVEESDVTGFQAKLGNNLSLIEYELVSVPVDQATAAAAAVAAAQ